MLLGVLPHLKNLTLVNQAMDPEETAIVIPATFPFSLTHFIAEDINPPLCHTILAASAATLKTASCQIEVFISQEKLATTLVALEKLRSGLQASNDDSQLCRAFSTLSTIPKLTTLTLWNVGTAALDALRLTIPPRLQTLGLDTWEALPAQGVSDIVTFPSNIALRVLSVRGRAQWTEMDALRVKIACLKVGVELLLSPEVVNRFY